MNLVEFKRRKIKCFGHHSLFELRCTKSAVTNSSLCEMCLYIPTHTFFLLSLPVQREPDTCCNYYVRRGNSSLCEISVQIPEVITICGIRVSNRLFLCSTWLPNTSLITKPRVNFSRASTKLHPQEKHELMTEVVKQVLNCSHTFWGEYEGSAPSSLFSKCALAAIIEGRFVHVNGCSTSHLESFLYYVSCQE